METLDNNNTKFQRPDLLKVISILSLISIGYSLLMNLMSVFQGPPSAEAIEAEIASAAPMITMMKDGGQFYMAEVMTKLFKLITYIAANFYMHTIIQIVGLGTGLAGVLLMRRGRKMGFHLYIIYSLILVFSIYASAPVSEIPPFYLIMNASISLIFIILYSRNLKVMR